MKNETNTVNNRIGSSNGNGRSNSHNAAERLSVLSQAPAAKVKVLAEGLLDDLGAIDVIENRTGLVMLPYTDSVQGITFHLGEVLIAEARVRLTDHDVEGYGSCLGRDLVQALALALLDAALRAGISTAAINTLADTCTVELADADADLLRRVATTRVNMETF